MGWQEALFIWLVGTAMLYFLQFLHPETDYEE